MDDRPQLNLPSDEGLSIIGDQDIGDRFLAFARYGHSNGDLTNIKTWTDRRRPEGMLGNEDDLTGVAGSIAEPATSGLRNEKVVEIFHRWQLTARSQFTVGAQLIVDPSNAPTDDTLGVFSVRFRFDF